MGEKWPPSSFQERDDGYGYEVFPFFSHLVPFGPTLIEAFACKKKKKMVNVSVLSFVQGPFS